MTGVATQKVSSEAAPVGKDGQVDLASGERMAMRLWRNEKPISDKPARRHPYEVLGFVISGEADLLIEGQTISLLPGDSWVVPAQAEHTYRIKKTFTAVETTAPSYNG